MAPARDPHYTLTMHIGIDARLPTYQMGGISRYTLHLLSALAEQDPHNRYTIFQSRKEQRPFVPAAARWRTRRLWTPCHHRLEPLALGVELLPYRLDVLHSPDFIPPAFGARRRVITVHDLYFLHRPETKSPASRRYYNDQITWAVDAADHIIAVSESTRQELVDLLRVPGEKVTTVYHAANPIYRRPVSAEARARTLARYSLSPGFTLFVGTLEPRKNIMMLLSAFARMRVDTGYDAPLVLVGNKGWLYDELFAEVEALQLGSSVIHLPGVTDDHLAALYNAAGVLALPSHYEGFGLPVLEAMHCGCPVIASNRGALPEVLGDAGLLLPPTDAGAWADGLCRVLSDGDLAQRLIQAGRKRASAFTWEKTATRTLAVYEQAANA
ncbi:MAG: glycosyltransferase family 1 protein [Candidatus Promineifilaceae bacterium]|nr:glycosyltransferase family 1 protein [Candidatus Promineifilaceae bacterium]